MRRSTIFLFISLCCFGMECGGNPLPIESCISVSGVGQIPNGNAAGTDHSGVFRRVTAVETACAICESNTSNDPFCDPPNIPPDQIWSFNQDDGELVVEISSNGQTVSLRGGIDGDGNFSVGGIATPETSEGAQTGQALLLLEGTFSGDRVIGNVTGRLTANAPNGTVLDIQQVQSAIFERMD